MLLNQPSIKISIMILSVIILALFFLPWMSTLTGYYMMVTAWINDEFDSLVTWSSRLWLAATVLSIVWVMLITYGLNNKSRLNANLIFWMPLICLLSFILSIFKTVYPLSDYKNPLRSFDFTFFVVLSLSVLIGVAGSLYTKHSAKKNDFTVLERIGHVLLLPGLLYPCVAWTSSRFSTPAITLKSFSNNYVMKEVLHINWLFFAIATVFWILFVKYRFARRVFMGIGLLGFMLFLLQTSFPDFIGYSEFNLSNIFNPRYLTYLTFSLTPYLIIAIMVIAAARATKLSCPACNTFYSGQLIKSQKDGETVRTEQYTERVNVGEYKQSLDYDPGQVMYAKDSDYIFVTKKRKITVSHHTGFAHCRDCGHNWNFGYTL